MSTNTQAMVVASLLMVGLSSPNVAQADPFEDAIGGALVGGVIGGLAGGQGGTVAGLAIGAGAGLLVGAADEEKRRRKAEQERLEIERQRWQSEQRMQEQLSAQRQQVAAAQPAAQPAASGAPPPAALVADTQRSLTILGYQPGGIDGTFGSATVEAIRAYETNNGLLVTGQVSSQLLLHMRQNGG